LDDARNLKYASCQCPAGSGSRCKHIVAVIAYVNSEDGTSKTDEPQQWGKPSKMGEKMYKKGKQISELFPPKRLKLDIKSLTHDELIQHHNVLKIPCTLSLNLTQEKRTDIERTCQNVMNYIINDLEDHFLTEQNNTYLSEIIDKQTLSNTTNTYYIFPLNFKEHTIYHQEVNVNEEIIKQIFNQTLNQSNDKLWSHHRKIRISASLKAHKIKVSRNTSINGQTRLAMSLINENTITGQGLSNVLYGSQTEKKAIEIFSTMFNLKVLKCGLVVHKDQPWLCASPDGLIIKNNKINSALEIKCPISCKKKHIINPDTGESNLKYLKLQQGKIILNPRHMYYTQIQIILHCTNLNTCNLFIFNEIDPLLLVIEKDITFLNNIIPKLNEFYFAYYLPNLCA